MHGARDNTLSSERKSGSATHVRTPTRAWDDIAQDIDTLEKEIQRSTDRYYKWLIEMCQRTADMDPSSSGERIGRLRRRRDREFDRLMHRYSALGVRDPRPGSSLPLLTENAAHPN